MHLSSLGVGGSTHPFASRAPRGQTPSRVRGLFHFQQLEPFSDCRLTNLVPPSQASQMERNSNSFKFRKSAPKPEEQFGVQGNVVYTVHICLFAIASKTEIILPQTHPTSEPPYHITSPYFAIKKREQWRQIFAYWDIRYLLTGISRSSGPPLVLPRRT